MGIPTAILYPKRTSAQGTKRQILSTSLAAAPVSKHGFGDDAQRLLCCADEQ